MGQSRSVYRYILLPSFIGLVCYACALTPKEDTDASQKAGADSSNIKQVVDSENQADVKVASQSGNQLVETETAAVSSQAADARYREGINLASSAYTLTLSAVSPDDWGLIASRWSRAADQLRKVNASSEHYNIAQQKIAEYTRHADHATAQIKALQQTVYIPLRPSARSNDYFIDRPSTQLPQPIAEIPANTPPTASSARIRIPIVRRLHGTPVVQILFNGERTYEMILDTGASRTLITRAMADELGVVPTERMVAATASAAEVTFDIGEMYSMSMGNATLKNAKVSIGDSVSIGLLGNDFLRGYDVTIRNREVELAIAQ